LQRLARFARQLHRQRDAELGAMSRAFAEGPDRTAMPVKASPIDAALAGCCTLIVEDNEDGREMMAMLLDSFGTRVLQAADGAAGLEAARVHLPDIALVDIGLPGMDGYEVARRLRADPATRGMRLVALTGYGLLEDQQRALQAGFDLHLVKPVPPERLREAIVSCLKAPVIE
jgi:CheY-like chemotaxis protein